jgi:nitronate monooxygenase
LLIKSNDKVGQFCIDKQLGLALNGDQQKGLFFRGAGILPFGHEIRPVRDLMAFLLSGHVLQSNPT